jgi:hypothetical protein
VLIHQDCGAPHSSLAVAAVRDSRNTLTSIRDVLRGERDTLAFWGLLIAAVAALAVLVTLTLSPQRGADPLEVRATPFPFGSMPALSPPSPVQVIPIPMEPLPSATSSTVEPPARFAVASPPAPENKKPAKPPKPPEPEPPWAAWLGRTSALEFAERPGMLVRHRNFVAQLEQIGSASRAPDRADATFVVRTGLAGTGCLSFESSNFDGFYLRHRDFLLRLHKNDRSRLFREDATFCPEPASDGTLTLRSLNYPDRRLTLQWFRVALTPVPSSKALRVRLRPPP